MIDSNDSDSEKKKRKEERERLKDIIAVLHDRVSALNSEIVRLKEKLFKSSPNKNKDKD